MAESFQGIDDKLERAVAHINNLDRQLAAFADQEPYSVRVQKDPHEGDFIGRLIAVKNPNVGAPDVSMVLLAGEVLYQLRSALDHLVHQLVIRSGNASKLETSRRHQFPIFKDPDRYAARAAGMIDGVSKSIASLIEGEQPYKRRPDAPENDPLWILQDLNNTDKHRIIPVTIVALDIARAQADNTSGDLFTVQGAVPLEHDKMLFSFRFIDAGRYDNIHANLTCAVSFQQAMEISGVAVGMDTMLWRINSRVWHIVEMLQKMPT
jgi:hypothetical protein